MKHCDNCGGEHPDSKLQVIKWWWHDAPRSWPDWRRFLYATVPLYGRWVTPLREWWSHEFVEIRLRRSLGRIADQMAQQDMVIQLEADDPRVGGLMNFLASGEHRKVN